MEKSPKTRSASGTWVVVKFKSGVVLETLEQYLAYCAPEGKVMLVSFSKSELKKWLRSYEHHMKESA